MDRLDQVREKMKKIILNDEWLDRFIDYTIVHGKEHDESFSSEEEMKQFSVNENNPTILLTDDEGKRILGTASLLYLEYYLRGSRARLRIFHVLNELQDKAAAYGELNDFVIEQLEQKELNHAFLFVPLVEEQTIQLFKAMDMQVERYVFSMVNTLERIAPCTFPNKMELRNFGKGRDEEVWIEIRNEAFSTLTGNATPMTLEELKEYNESPEYVEGGMKMLYEGDKPVGIIRIAEITENGESFAELGPVAVLEKYRNRGLGKNLIRAGLQFAKETGYSKVELCVDAQNQYAKQIYETEGFREKEGLVCLEIQNRNCSPTE